MDNVPHNTQYATRDTSKGHSTSVENPLQIDLFMQNKPNFRKAKMNVSYSNKMNYKKTNLALSEVEWANSNPIKANLQKAKMNVNLYVIKDYRKKDDFIVRINKPNFQNVKNERKYLYHKGLQKKRLFSTPKNKPNSNPIKPCPELAEALSAAEGAVEWANFKWGRLLIDPMLPLYKLSNVQYYSRHNFKVKFPKISIISILRSAKLTKYRWKITPEAVIFNPIKKLTIARTSDNLKGRRVIWRFESLLIWGIGTYFLGR